MAAPLTAKAWPIQPSRSWSEADLNFLRDCQIRYLELEESDLERLRELAENGLAGAANFLSRYFNLAGDMEKAVNWGRQAVKCGSVPGAMSLADLYYPIDGSFGKTNFKISPDFVTSYVWQSIAIAGLADLNSKNSSEELEKRQNGLAAVDAFMLPSEREKAEKILALWPEELPPHMPAAFRPEDKVLKDSSDLKRVVKDLTEMAEAGDLEAMKELAFMYHLHPDLAKGPEESFSLYQRAAGLGDKEAAYAVALSYIYELGVPKDEARGEKFIREQAVKGDPQAFMILCRLAEKRGHNAEAKEWLDKAVAQNYSPAFMHLASIAEKAGKDQEALQWTLKAADWAAGKDLMRAAAWLRQQDQSDKAALCWEKAAREGNLDAIGELIGYGEHRRDLKAIIRWATVGILRSPPGQAHRMRSVLIFAGHGEPPELLRQGMIEGEAWHKKYPAGAGVSAPQGIRPSR
jgi:TPR repeat protein